MLRLIQGSLSKIIVIASCIALQSACSTLNTINNPGYSSISGQHDLPTTAIVTLHDGTKYEGQLHRVDQNTLYFSDRSFAFSDVASISIEEISASRSLAVVGGTTLAIYAIAAIVVSAVVRDGLK
jgi:hypothetical protein